MSKKLIKNATIINEGKEFVGSVLIDGERIEKIYEGECPAEVASGCEALNAEGMWLIPGVIDDQVHFREPGLTYKADINSESRAAAAGGVTTFMDMPNTVPQTTTIEELDRKFAIASENSLINYSFYLGATNENQKELERSGASRACGIKVFMGSSTGNMLVDDQDALAAIFASTDRLIATHCEDEAVIAANKKYYISQFGENLPIGFHSLIRSEEACFRSSFKAVNLALKYNTRLHLLHLTTAKEMSLLSNNLSLSEKRITAEVCVPHLWFDERDYERYGNKLKWNPAIKKKTDKLALREAVNDGLLDIVATDHAPHLWEEKQGSCLKATSGGPMIQHSLTTMLELHKKGVFTKEKVVETMCHNPATLFRIKDRGFIREGYYADLVLIDPNMEWRVSESNLLYKCQWSPLMGRKFTTQVVCTISNGEIVFANGMVNDEIRGKEIEFKD